MARSSAIAAQLFASIMSSQTADSIDGAAAAFSSFGRISQSGDTSDGATDARSSMKLGSSDSSAHVGALLGRCMSHGLQLGDGLKEGGPGVRVGFDKYGRGLFTDKRIEPDKRLLYVPAKLLVTSELVYEEEVFRELLSCEESNAMRLHGRPEIRLMLFLVADRARCDGVNHLQDKARSYGSGALLETSFPQWIERVDWLYQRFLAVLDNMPRNADGSVAMPAQLIRWLEDTGQLRLDGEAAGTLLAVCDLKGKPTLNQFEACTCMKAKTSHVALCQRPSRQLFYDAIPSAYPELPMYWPDEQLDALLPPLRANFVRAQRAERDDLIGLLKNRAPKLWKAAVEAWDKNGRWADPLSWAHATVRSRSYGFVDGGKVVAAMCPFADLANHAEPSKVNAQWSFDETAEGGGAFCVHATRSSEAGYYGQEIFYSYGSGKPNGDLLMHYGFVLEASDDDDVLFEIERRDKHAASLPPAQRSVCVYVRPTMEDSGVHHTIAIMRALVQFGEDDFEEEEGVFTPHRMSRTSTGSLVPVGTSAPGSGLPPVSDENELAAITALAARAGVAKAKLTKFIQAKEATAGSWPADAEKAAAVVCAGELKALTWMEKACREMLDKHKAGVSFDLEGMTEPANSQQAYSSTMARPHSAAELRSPDDKEEAPAVC